MKIFHLLRLFRCGPHKYYMLRVNTQTPNILNVDVSQFAPIETQVATWKPNSFMSISWGFVFVNDDLLMNLVKSNVVMHNLQIQTNI